MIRNSIPIILVIIVVIGLGNFFVTNGIIAQNSEMETSSQATQKTLTLSGSNTVGESFAPLLAKSFLQFSGAMFIQEVQLNNPVEKYIEGIIPETNTKIKIAIKAHGSSTGFTALYKKKTEIAMSSRLIKPEEQEQISSIIGEIKEHPIALDALAIITHPNNPINQITIEQIATIFSGQVSNWKELGGNDQKITLFSRDNNSGTWDTFKNLVLKPFAFELDKNATRYESSQELVSQVVNTPGALGFVGVSYVNNSKLLKVSKTSSEVASKPSGYTIGTEAYPLSRKLYLYTAGKKTEPLVQSFIDFVNQNEGQKNSEKVGLISYYPTHYRPQEINKSTPMRYRDLASLGKRITVNFTGKNSSDLSKKEVRDIERLKNYAQQNPGRKIVLVDFSDSTRLNQLKSILEENQISVLDTFKLNYQSRQSDDIEVWVL